MSEIKRIFIDMDGVLCALNEDASVEDMEKDGFFRNLAPRTAMLDAVKELIGMDGAAVYILSAVLPQRIAEATAEKIGWLDEYLPEIDCSHRIFTVCGMSKADAVCGISESDVLCDDYSVNLADWVNAGGRAVKILNEINGRNGSFTSGPRLKISHRRDLVNAIMAM